MDRPDRRAGFPRRVRRIPRGASRRLVADEWNLNLLVWEHGALVGNQTVLAKAFGTRRCVATGSWLGRAHQGRGIGAEMRAAVLELSFRGLGAVEAESGWLEGNNASRRVSEKLG